LTANYYLKLSSVSHFMNYYLVIMKNYLALKN